MEERDFVIEDDLGVIESPEDIEEIKEDISIEEVEEIDLGTVSDTVQMAHPFGLFCGAKRSRCVAERSDVVRF